MYGFEAPYYNSFLSQVPLVVVAEWYEPLGYDVESRRKVVSSRLVFAMRRLENSFCQPSSKWVSFFELGKAKAVKGDGWAPPFISCAQDTVGL